MRSGSDVDVALLLDPSLPEEESFKLKLAIARDLEQVLKRRADVVVLNGASLLLRYSVYRAGI